MQLSCEAYCDLGKSYQQKGQYEEAEIDGQPFDNWRKMDGNRWENSEQIWW